MNGRTHVAALLAVAGCAAAIAIPGAVLGQDGDQPDPAGSVVPENPIIVTPPDSARERRQELRNLGAQIIREPRAGQTIATFFEGICPKVFGLPDAPARAIEARVRANADAVGADRRIRSEDCRHNLSVIFVRPDRGSPDQWLTHKSDLLSHLLSFQRERVLSEEGPVRAWTYQHTRTTDGAPMPDATQRRLSNAVDFSNRIWTASRLRSQATYEISGAMVMIELASADGKTLNQLADYATMRGLADTSGIDPRAEPSAPTILTLFHDDAPPEQLTSFDRALLTSLYSTSRNAITSRYLGSIANRALRMEREEPTRPLAE